MSDKDQNAAYNFPMDAKNSWDTAASVCEETEKIIELRATQNQARSISINSN